MHELLLVDDERVIREGLRALLEGEGYSVRVARNGEEALQKFRERLPDLILLDVMMPGMSGFRLCEQIRVVDRELPIVFLTCRMSEVDQVRGLGLGGDDYISKSADDAVLLARIRRLLERRQLRVRSEDELPRRIRLGELTVDFDGMTVVGRGKTANLTKSEADVLWLLNSSPGRYFSHAEIEEILGNTRADYCENGVYMVIYRIKRKLGRYGHLIDCSRGAGYKLVMI